MKKLLAAMLALSIGLLAPVGALGESVEASALTVGSVTEMSGSFYSGLWGNNHPIWMFVGCFTGMPPSRGSARVITPLIRPRLRMS